MLYHSRWSFLTGIGTEASYTLRTLEKTPLRKLLFSMHIFVFQFSVRRCLRRFVSCLHRPGSWKSRRRAEAEESTWWIFDLALFSPSHVSSAVACSLAPSNAELKNWDLSVFCSGVSNRINFGEAENWSWRQHFNSKPSIHQYPLV